MSGARKYANQTLLRYMAQGEVEYAKNWAIPFLSCFILIMEIA